MELSSPMQASNAAQPSWRRASRCASSGCVEFAQIGNDIALRDSKTVDSPVLTYNRDEWRTFVAGVKAGEFDV
jgi:Domain of unknown function (DUF397)